MSLPRILVINPNSSTQMTADMERTIAQLTQMAAFSYQIVCMPHAPHVLESFSDYNLAGAEVQAYYQAHKAEIEKNFDGIVLACFGDPALYALKEIAALPLVGIAESAFSLALLLGYKYTVFAASGKAKPMMESLIQMYGLELRSAGVMTLNKPIDDFLGHPESLETAIVKQCEKARQSGAEVVILGCAGMTGIARVIEQKTGLTVIDPVLAGCTAILQVIFGGFSVSRAGLYQSTEKEG